ncbi:neprilysin-1-like isoform X1 [Stegodyphus dumicola]|uniref:neprilysin-1-like isoform X1 n=1 Tax=Stegodyphus dumicola TaxID=202533 RepID=UPI0015A791DC|nr:neprilysin-1-like isoform X1 [Stegodyphus dumicola]
MTMALKGTHSPNGHTDNLPEYEMLANGNPGKKPELDPKKTVVRIQENPLAELNTEKPPLPNDMVQLRIEKGESRCGSRFRAGYRTTFELFLSLTIAVLGLTCCALFYMIFLQAGRPSLNICLTQECVKTAASLLNAMDQSSDPCDDFFQYACGTWNKLHMIPQDRSSISTFEVMADDLQVILKGLLEEPANNHDNSATIKAKTFYKSCISTAQIDAIGDKPLRDVVKELGGWPVAERDWVEPEWPLEHLLGQLRGDYNQGIIIEQWVGPDDKNSSVNVIQLDQMTFGLPSREYFLKDSSERERKAYLKLMVEIATLYGAERETAEIDMSDVLDLEIRLANASTPEADRHDTGAIYNKMSLQELSEIVPEFDWVYYLNTFLPTKIDDQEPVVVYALPYLQEMGQIISQANRRTIHNYAIWRLIKHMIPFLDGEYSQKRTEFKKVLLGISAERERWNQCVDLVNKKMGMAVGALFIRDNFDPKSKETAQEMILNIREAFNELLEENAWMDKETREVARDKANAMNERIGYPDLLTNPVELSKEYEGLVIHDDLFLVNILNVFEFEAIKNLKKLRQPVNKDRWTTEPAVVNAFYNPNKNDIVFPAGILQPLFYSHYFPKSLNYGGIGVVIGHEMTHGFDDKGRQFDKEGNLKQWWNEATVRRFRERAQCIIDQYSSYVLEDIGLNINGKMTQGENIADNGGLKQAYRAYKKWVKRHGEEPLLPGLNLTHDQLFFLNYAQIWCGSMRPEDALSKVRSSVHSPGPIRVLGPLSNSYDFARTYNCPPGSRMNPSKKCSVW